MCDVFLKQRSSDRGLKPNNSKISGSKKIKGPKQRSKNRLKTSMPEGGEPSF